MPPPPLEVRLPKPSVEYDPLEGVAVQDPPLLPPPEEEEEADEGLEEVGEATGISVERLFMSAKLPEVRAASSMSVLVNCILKGGCFSCRVERLTIFPVWKDGEEKLSFRNECLL